MSDFTIDKPEGSTRALFEAREPGSSSGTATFGEQEQRARYNGVERRRQHRRVKADRREELRFELDKPDRRVNPGRRAGDKSPKFW
jgi:hypothetical protein